MINLGKIIKIKNHKRPSKVDDVVSVWTKKEKNSTDVLGSYTGTPSEEGDNRPVQDADDL